MRWRLARLAHLVLCTSWGCQLVDPPSDLDRGPPGAGPADSSLDGQGPDTAAAVGEGGVANDAGVAEEVGAAGDAGVAGEGGSAPGGRLLCATGGASYCAVGTQACCFPDPRGAGICSTVGACTSTYLFQCSGFANCAAGEVCCGVTAYLVDDGGALNAVGGSRCTLAAKCSGASPLVLCDFADTPDRCPGGTTCQPWSSAPGNRWPAGYDACQ